MLFAKRNKELGDKGTSRMSVCQIANHRHLPVHDVINLLR